MPNPPDFSKVIIDGPTASDPIPDNAIMDEDIPEMFDSVLSELRESGFKEMLEDVQLFYENRGFLTARQYEVLERAYFRVLREES